MSSVSCKSETKAESAVQLRLGAAVLARLRCPACAAELRLDESALVCESDVCGEAFPVIEGVPILLTRSNALFSAAEIARYDRFSRKASETISVGRYLPSLGLNVPARRMMRRFAAEVRLRRPKPAVLVIGGGTTGEGIEELLAADIDVVETDVSLTARTGLVCDAHELPFADGSFDGVVIQAVLEHVLDPRRCVAEIARVLRPEGCVYAETPFCQQVHAGPYDFTRFTHRGHRWLFRSFVEMDSGASAGPGSVLAWAFCHFLLSFSDSALPRRILRAVAHLSFFWLKYFDYFLLRHRGALDAASGYFFLGRKSDTDLSPDELVRGYRGAQ
jgi:SAM-dependent methyltransferase